ncbi:MAG: phosphotransferase family protein [Bryobacteraceae bacterium]
MPEETIPVRDPVDPDALGRFLSRSGWPAHFELRQFPAGHSNLTYLLSNESGEFVLRRPPPGPIAPKAHDMVREARILAAVHPGFPLAPEPLLVCEDASVLGAPFFLMERRRGRALLQAGEPKDEAVRPRIAAALVAALADLHRLDVTSPEIRSLGRPEGFLERQVQGWASRWDRAQTRDVPAMREVRERLIATMPSSAGAAVLHNDFKPDNVLLSHEDLSRPTAVLDWEMSALGDPLIDLGILLCYWPEPADPPGRRESVCPVTAAPGWPSRAAIALEYGRLTGLDVSDTAYYEAFALFKLAVILQQIFHRHSMGLTSDPRFAGLEQKVLNLADCAIECTRRATP